MKVTDRVLYYLHSFISKQVSTQSSKSVKRTLATGYIFLMVDVIRFFGISYKNGNVGHPVLFIFIGLFLLGGLVIYRIKIDTIEKAVITANLELGEPEISDKIIGAAISLFPFITYGILTLTGLHFVTQTT